MMDILPGIDSLLRGYPHNEAVIVEAMVAIHRAGCYRLACSILQDPDEAEDAIQQAFISAATHFDKYHPGSDFKAWIYTITINICRGLLRKRKTRQLLTSLLEIAQLHSSRSRSPEAEIGMKESSYELWAAVNRLDEKHRLVLILRFSQDLSISEIARILSIREKTVYTRLYKAMRQLRNQFGDEIRDDFQETPSLKEVLP